MGSSRLPGKVLADIAGKPALTRLLNRLRQCELLDGVVLATSTDPRDDLLASWAMAEGVDCHRGSEEDVLGRVVEAHQKMRSDLVVEVCGDMILLDPEVIDWGIQTFLANECDIITTSCKASFPIGVDALVFRLKDLLWVAGNISAPEMREHASLYFFSHPERYRIIHLMAPRRMRAPKKRFVLDYPEDLTFMREVYARLEPQYGDTFGVEEVLRLLDEDQTVGSINQHITE